MNIITPILAHHYHLKVESIAPLSLGADLNAALFKAQAGNASYFVKIKQGHLNDISIRIIELISEAGLQEIILPVKTIDGQLIQRMSDFTVIVYPFISGQDGFQRELSGHRWIKLGRAVKRIHHMDILLAIQKQMRRETFSSKWRDIVRSLDNPVEYPDAAGRQLWKFMQTHEFSIRRLVEGADLLANNYRKLRIRLCFVIQICMQATY